MRMLDRVAAFNMALVMTHQADAAYWREWEMFHLPGGIQFFDIFNLFAFALLLGCYAALVTRRRAGVRGSFVIASLSGMVLPIHAGFALAGFTQFHLPVSIAIILGTFPVSLWQIILTRQAHTEFGRDV
jgi:hypothetical protein